MDKTNKRKVESSKNARINLFGNTADEIIFVLWKIYGYLFKDVLPFSVAGQLQNF